MSSNTNPRKIIGANKAIVSLTQKYLSNHSRLKSSGGIRFTLWTDPEGRIRKFELSGHAGFAQAGQDIICAGVSALSIAAVNGLERFLSVAPQVREADGYLSCQLDGIAGQELEMAQWILQTMSIGIEQIQTAFGHDYILIDQRRWSPC